MLVRLPSNAAGDPLMGDFLDAIIIKTFGEVSDKFDEL
jgi:hypothetical protein